MPTVRRHVRPRRRSACESTPKSPASVLSPCSHSWMGAGTFLCLDRTTERFKRCTRSPASKRRCTDDPDRRPGAAPIQLCGGPRRSIPDGGSSTCGCGVGGLRVGHASSPSGSRSAGGGTALPVRTALGPPTLRRPATRPPARPGGERSCSTSTVCSTRRDRHVWVPTTWAVLPDDIQPSFRLKRCGLLSIELHHRPRPHPMLVELDGITQLTLGLDIADPCHR